MVFGLMSASRSKPLEQQVVRARGILALAACVVASSSIAQAACTIPAAGSRIDLGGRIARFNLLVKYGAVDAAQVPMDHGTSGDPSPCKGQLCSSNPIPTPTPPAVPVAQPRTETVACLSSHTIQAPRGASFHLVSPLSRVPAEFTPVIFHPPRG
jgi:hypothetical protein